MADETPLLVTREGPVILGHAACRAGRGSEPAPTD